MNTMIGFGGKEFSDRWLRMGLMEQMGNVGSEYERGLSWRRKGKTDFALRAFDRTLALLDLTIEDVRWKGSRRREIARARELVCNVIVNPPVQEEDSLGLAKYFFQFAVAARNQKAEAQNP